MHVLVDLLKFIIALAAGSWIIYYFFVNGLPPRGKGRWRKVLKELSDREDRR